MRVFNWGARGLTGQLAKRCPYSARQSFVWLVWLCAVMTAARVMGPSAEAGPAQQGEGGLSVVLVCFNPSNFTSRAAAVRAAQVRLSETEGVSRVVTVELAYDDAPFAATAAGNPRHLQLRWPRGVAPLWSKENLANLAVRRLLPAAWHAVAFLDAEALFEEPLWAVRTLHALGPSSYDAVQPFSSLTIMGVEFTSMGAAAVTRGGDLGHSGWNRGGRAAQGHHGFAWAMSRRAYETLGGLFELCIIGSADTVIVSALFADAGIFSREFTPRGLNEPALQPFRRVAEAYIDAASKRGPLRVGFVAGAAAHIDHGTLQDRRYDSRIASCLPGFDPKLHVAHDEQGLLLPTAAMPQEMASCIASYFASRREDHR